MLLTDKKVGESLFIGDSIVVKVLKTQGRRVRFAIKAPKEVAVANQTIYDARYNEKTGIIPKSLSEPLTEDFDINNCGTLIIDCEIGIPLRLGNDGIITIEKFRKSRVTLGVTTPKEVRVQYGKKLSTPKILPPDIRTHTSGVRFLEDNGLAERYANSLNSLKSKAQAQ